MASATETAGERGVDLKDPVVRLLNELGDRGVCRGCHAPIWFVRNKRGRVVPYSAAGVTHFADCPQAAQFRRPREATL